MRGLEKDTIGGYNGMLKKQKAIEGEAFITTVLFDNNYELLHDRIDIKAVNSITEKEYQVGVDISYLLPTHLLSDPKRTGHSYPAFHRW